MTSTTITPQTGALMPRLWAKFSVRTGTLLQLAGVTAGTALLIGARSTRDTAALGLVAVGYLAIYLCSHAIAHVAVGRLVGIRFRAYGIRGTDHPENYPPVMRQLMSALPMWSALTEKSSMASASGAAKAAMFSAGEASTSVFSLAAAVYVAHAGLPGGHAILVGTVLWTIASTITVAIVPKGDYAKALRAIGWRKPLAPSNKKSVESSRERDMGIEPPRTPRPRTAQRHRRLVCCQRRHDRSVGPRRGRFPLVPGRPGVLGLGRGQLGPPGSSRGEAVPVTTSPRRPSPSQPGHGCRGTRRVRGLIVRKVIMTTNPNYRTYLGTALQLQRWRDFVAHVTAYVVINAILIIVWLLSGRGAFWPGVSLAAWGLGLSSQHWLNAVRGPITDEEVRRRMEGPSAAAQ